MKQTKCRYCHGKVTQIVSLGTMPLVNYFPKREEAKKRATWYPLTLCMCDTCGLVQLGYIVKPEDIFSSYHYFTGASKPLITHLQEMALWAKKTFNLNDKSHVLDIGSNDGTLLSAFKKIGVSGIGVEPAGNLAKTSRAKGITTIHGYLTRKRGRAIVHKHGRFDFISATHVLANIPDLYDFMAGVTSLLAPDGVFVVEVASVASMLAHGQFDSIYHEHYSYFSVAFLTKLFSDYGLSIVSVEKLSDQGGSLRVVARFEPNDTPIVYTEHISYADMVRFAKHVADYREHIRELLTPWKGKRIIGFGAPAKAVVMVHYCDLADCISLIVDSTKVKQGRVLPGSMIPIYSEAYLRRSKPDCVIVFAWNYQEEILKKLAPLRKKGVKILLPFPELTLL